MKIKKPVCEGGRENLGELFIWFLISKNDTGGQRGTWEKAGARKGGLRGEPVQGRIRVCHGQTGRAALGVQSRQGVGAGSCRPRKPHWDGPSSATCSIPSWSKGNGWTCPSNQSPPGHHLQLTPLLLENVRQYRPFAEHLVSFWKKTALQDCQKNNINLLLPYDGHASGDTTFKSQ